MPKTNLTWARLSTEVETRGRPFDGMAPGTFIDMYGRKFVIEPEELELYVENTQRALEATRDEDGEIGGLPIDTQAHDGLESAGFIVAVELDTTSLDYPVIRFTPQWNDLGIDLISREVMKYFSPTLDPKRKVIAGGSLTNWPATRDFETGDLMLRPIKLESSLFFLETMQEVDGDALEERVYRVRRAWWEAEDQRAGPVSDVVEVFDDHIVAERADGYWEVAYQISEESGEIIFADTSEWVRVRRAWVEAARDTLARTWLRLTGGKPDELEADPDEEGDDTMPGLKFEDLTAEQKMELGSQAIAALFSGIKVDDDEEFMKLSDPGARLLHLIDRKADAKAEAVITAAERERELDEFVKLSTAGPLAIPMKADDLKALMAPLSAEGREAVEQVIKTVLEKGLVEFSESGERGRGTAGEFVELGEADKKVIRQFIAAGYSLEKFFEINAEVYGDMAQYDLSDFEPSDDGKEK